MKLSDSITNGVYPSFDIQKCAHHTPYIILCISVIEANAVGLPYKLAPHRYRGSYKLCATAIVLVLVDLAA